MNFSLVLLAFCNILIGALAFEYLVYSAIITLAVISRANVALHRHNGRGVDDKVD